MQTIIEHFYNLALPQFRTYRLHLSKICVLATTLYLDGELNQEAVESHLSVDQANRYSIASVRFVIGSYFGQSWPGTVYLSAKYQCFHWYGK